MIGQIDNNKYKIRYELEKQTSEEQADNQGEGKAEAFPMQAHDNITLEDYDHEYGEEFVDLTDLQNELGLNPKNASPNQVAGGVVAPQGLSSFQLNRPGPIGNLGAASKQPKSRGYEMFEQEDVDGQMHSDPHCYGQEFEEGDEDAFDLNQQVMGLGMKQFDLGEHDQFLGELENNFANNQHQDPMAAINHSPDEKYGVEVYDDDYDDFEGQPMEEFLANAFGNQSNQSSPGEKMLDLGAAQKVGMLNSLKLLGQDDAQNDFELENAAFNFNALTMLPKEDKNIKGNIPSSGGPGNNTKPNFENIGTFKGIRGLSNNFKGLSNLQDFDEDELIEGNEKGLAKQVQQKQGLVSQLPKSNFDIFTPSDDEDVVDDGDYLPPIGNDDGIEDLMPEIIKDEEFEGEFDWNNNGGGSSTGNQRDTQNTENTTEGENSNTSDENFEGDDGSGSGLGYLANCEQGRKKKIDVRKGLSVERNFRFDEQHRPLKEFNVLQHSQSNFEGLKNHVIDVRRANHIRNDKQGQMALRSFKNAGGSFKEDEKLFGQGFPGQEEEGFGLGDDEDENNEEETKIKNDPSWKTNEKFTRWIIVEAATKKLLPQPIQQTIATDQIQELTQSNKKYYFDIFQQWAKRKDEEKEAKERENAEKQRAEKEKIERQNAEKEMAAKSNQQSIKSKTSVAAPTSSAPSFTQKKKLNKADYMFKMLKDQILIKKPGDIDGLQFMIKDLENCSVFLMDHSAQITVDRCKNTKFFIGPIKASIFFRDCSDCEITVTTCQFRCRDLIDSTVYVYSPNEPIIESSSNLVFAPYNLKYPWLKQHSEKADVVGQFTDDDGVVQKKVNRWNQIHDFTKRSDGLLNYKLLPPGQFSTLSVSDLGVDLPEPPEDQKQFAEFIYELPEEYGGSLKQNELLEMGRKNGLMAFDITTGAEQAQQAFEKKQNEEKKINEAQNSSQVQQKLTRKEDQPVVDDFNKLGNQSQGPQLLSKTPTEGTKDVEDGISGSVQPLSPGGRGSAQAGGKKKLVIKGIVYYFSGLRGTFVAQSQVVGGKHPQGVQMRSSNFGVGVDSALSQGRNNNNIDFSSSSSFLMDQHKQDSLILVKNNKSNSHFEDVAKGSANYYSNNFTKKQLLSNFKNIGALQQKQILLQAVKSDERLLNNEEASRGDADESIISLQNQSTVIKKIKFKGLKKQGIGAVGSSKPTRSGSAQQIKYQGGAHPGRIIGGDSASGKLGAARLMNNYLTSTESRASEGINGPLVVSGLEAKKKIKIKVRGRLSQSVMKGEGK